MEARSTSTPFSIEPRTGWRVWRLARRDDGSLTLLAVVWSDEWPAREAARASCRTHPDVAAPLDSCSCGLYAAASPEALASSQVFNRTTTVVGAVAMWGTTVEHARGARAQWSYPARLRLVCAPCLAAGRGAVVPRFVVGSAPSLVAVCRRHRVRAPGLPVSASEVQAELLSTYAVDLVPLERIARSLKVRRPLDLQKVPLKVIELVFQAIGLVINGVMLLFLAAWALAIVRAVGGWLLRVLFAI